MFARASWGMHWASLASWAAVGIRERKLTNAFSVARAPPRRSSIDALPQLVIRPPKLSNPESTLKIDGLVAAWMDREFMGGELA